MASHKNVQPRTLECQTELTVTENGILLRGSRIVMPQVLQDKTISLVNIEHEGITRQNHCLVSQP